MLVVPPEYERAAVRWEQQFVDPRDASLIGRDHFQAVVDHAWWLAQMPCKPPTVKYQDPKAEDYEYAPGALASIEQDQTRINMYRLKLATTVALHEVAHGLTEHGIAKLELRKPVENASHGPLWLANYLWLLDKLMGPQFNTFYLRSTLPPILREYPLNFYPTLWGTPRPDLVR